VSYLGPDNMELPDAQRKPKSYVITPGIPANLKTALLGKIEGGDVVQVTESGANNAPYGPRMEVFDTDGEGSLLWNDEGAVDEAGTRGFCLYTALQVGKRVKVHPA